MSKLDVNKLLQVSEYEEKIFMPNEIFADLKQGLKGKHIAFTYAYYYLCLWLYRYAKYGNIAVDVKMVKEILGISSTNKTIDYVIKKDGILDQLDYTFSTTDYPYVWKFNEGDIIFETVSELDAEMRRMLSRGNNYKIKVPVKGLWRNTESEKDNDLNGVFYDVSDTHYINWNVFVRCVENEELGCVAFYIYGYLKRQCDIHSEYNSSYDKLASELGIARCTVIKYIRGLSDIGIVNVKENNCKKVEGDFKKEANTYTLLI